MISVFAQDVLIMIIELFNTIYTFCRWLHKMQLQKLPWSELRHTRCHHTLWHFLSVAPTFLITAREDFWTSSSTPPNIHQPDWVSPWQTQDIKAVSDPASARPQWQCLLARRSPSSTNNGPGDHQSCWLRRKSRHVPFLLDKIMGKI